MEKKIKGKKKEREIMYYKTVHIYRCMRRGMRDLRTIYVCTYISIYVQAHTENTHMYTET